MRKLKVFSLDILIFLILITVCINYEYLGCFAPAKSFNTTSWLVGWDRRKSHVINPASGAGTNYQVQIIVLHSDTSKSFIPLSSVKSTLPVPSGTKIQSGQAATYWDGTYLHVWYGAQTSFGDDRTDDIYYTKSSDLINWDAPVKVIDRPSGEGIRDPISIITSNTIYLLCQCFDGSKYFIRLYKISKSADFTNSANYIHVGIALDVGSSGQFDDVMVASPAVILIGSTYWLMYEAKCSDGKFSIGRAYFTNIESIPYTKDGQLKDTNGNIIRSPVGETYEICPDSFIDEETLVINYWSSTVQFRLITGDFPNNSVTLGSDDLIPQDDYANHDTFSYVNINGNPYFLSTSWTTGDHYVRLYTLPSNAVSLHGNCRTDFGDIRFTDDDGVTLLDYWMESYSFTPEEYSEYSDNPIQSYTDDGMDWPICVLKDGSYFYKYYAKTYGTDRKIYRAKSSDGKTGWTDNPSTPVLEGKAGTKYAEGVTCPNVWKENGTYKMLFSGLYTGDGKWRTFYATSSDGVNWTVQNNDNPVLEPTEAWEYHCEPWGLIKVGNTYYLWYNNIGFGGSERATGLATSTDCITWTKDSNNPIFTNGRFMTNVVKYGNYYYLFIFYYYAQGKSCIELYRDTSPTFYPNSREFIQVIKYPIADSSWEADILDAITVLTDDITKSTFTVTNGELWIYYGANTGTTRGHGLLIEPSLEVLNGKGERYATFWVKVADDLSTNPATIYIYYGNPAATSISNGDNTFIYFNNFDVSEDFTEEDGTWQLDAFNSIYKYVSEGVGQVQSWKDIGRSANEGYRLRVKHKSSAQHDSGIFSRYENGYSYGGIFAGKGSAGKEDVGGFAENAWTYLYRQPSPTGTSWHISEVLNFKQRYVVFIDGIQRYGGNINFHLSSTKIALAAWAGNAAEFDWVFVAKNVDPEPTHSAWGIEEQAGAAPTPSISVSDINVNTTRAAKPCNFSAVFTAQNSNLSHYIFGTNNTGAWINDTAVSLGEGKTQVLASIIKTLNSTIGTVIQWQIWANNTAGNWTTTGIQTLTTSGNQSTIATLTTYGYAAVEYACQRKTFYANGRFWVFYYDGASSAGYSTSTDGFSWTPFAPFTSRTCGAGWRFAVALDGTRLHYVFSTGTNGDPLYYRCGLPNADGTITWLDNEQNITIGESDTGHLWPSIAIDSEGRPWVAYARKNATENSRYAYVTTSITSNGTWITRVGFPHRLSSTNYTGINVMIVPLTNQKMLAIVSCGGWKIESYLWNGSSWSEKQTTSSAITSDGIIECGLSAVNQGDDVHLVFIKDSTHDLVYTKYSYASNSWGPETIVQPAVTSETSPVLSIDSATNMLYCFWAGAPTADCIYYKVYNGSAWSFVEGSNPWIIERNLAGYYRYDGLSGFYKSNNNLLGLAYTNGAYGVYQLKFAFLTTKARQYVIIDQALVSDERANVGSVQTVMFHAKWSNGSDVVHGSIYVNGTEYVTDNMGWITFEVTLPQIGKDEWGVTAVSCSGVIDYMQSAQNPSIIWDRVIILLSVSNNRIDTGATANIAKTAFYEYDSSPFIGTITLNDTATKTTVGRYGYKVSSISDPIYGLTSFTTNEVYCIFDRVTINTFTATDNRINVGDTANFVVSGVYEYDLAPWVGSYILNDTIAKPTVGKYGYKIAGITDSKYGLTAFKQTAPDVYVIFDRISVDSYGTDDARRDVNTEATFYLTLKYEYDDTLVADGFAYLNGSLPLTWSPISSRWELKTTSPIVQKLIVYLENVNGNAYGITALNPAVPTKKISVIWDRIQIVDGGTTKTTLTIGETAIVWFKAQYEYDGAVFTGANGTLYVNGTALTWSKTNSRWEYQYTAKKPGTAAFAISGVSDISQGLTAINDEVGTQTIIVRKRTR